MANLNILYFILTLMPVDEQGKKSPNMVNSSRNRSTWTNQQFCSVGPGRPRVVRDADAVADLGDGEGLVLQKQTGAVDALFGDVIEDRRAKAVMADLVKGVFGDAELAAEHADGKVLRQVLVDVGGKVIRQDVIFHGDEVFGDDIADAETVHKYRNFPY